MTEPIRLSRAYASIYGAPAIDRVDAEIFRLRYFTACMDCGFCHDQCCSYGVDVDQANVERLLALGEGFEARIGVPQAQWFTGESIADREFPSGSYRRTRTVDSKCVFASREGRGCLIHAWCLDKGIDYHSLKPMVSVLFPLTFDHGVLHASDEVRDGSLICADQGPTLYEGMRPELAYYFGSDFAAELDVLASEQVQRRHLTSESARLSKSVP